MSTSLNPANRSGGETAGGADLIIPDIHLQWNRADRIIQRENCDRIWLLGDYFDDYGDTVAQVEQACEWLLGVCKDKRIHRLLGNHDVYYFCDNKAYRGAGYSREKHSVIEKYFSPRIIQEKFTLYGRTRGYLLTHAGFSGRWLKKFSKASIDRNLQEAFEAMLGNQVHPLLNIGADRGRVERSRRSDVVRLAVLKPIAGVPQIVGHTYHKNVQWAGFERLGDSEFNFGHCVLAA